MPTTGGDERPSLRDYLEREISHAQALFEVYAQSQREALDDARREIERRLSELNQVRQQVLDDRELFLRRETYEVQHHDLEVRINKVEERLNASAASLSGSRYAIGIAFAVGGLLVSIGALLVHFITS